MSTGNVKNRPGEIGACGLLVHEADASGYTYYPDNDKESWRAFAIEPPAIASGCGFELTSLDAIVKSRSPVAQLAPRTFLVNLDAFQGLPNLSARPTTASSGTGAYAPVRNVNVDLDVFLIHENGAYFAVGRSDLRKLDALDEGDAKVVVKRGAVAAAIPPNDLPIGTHCVLINLSQLVP